MSGGFFNYKNYIINDLIESIERLIDDNGKDGENCFGDRMYHSFSPETITEFTKAVEIMKIASTYAHRIDYLLSGDDGEETFRKQLTEDLENIDEIWE